MGITLIFVSQWNGDGGRKWSILIGLVLAMKHIQEIASTETVPETDTGGMVEHTKTPERTVLKELGKLHL